MKKTKKKASFSKTVVKYMELILDLCEENQIELVLMSAPSPKNYSYKKHNRLTQYAEKHSLEYLDLNLKLKEIGIDWEMDSLDKGDHLNFSGAVKVSAYLGAWLNARGEFTDHRNDPAYADWNREEEEYQKDQGKKS